jgi:pimeloyl-ACP methyl ester carboxylesterase
MPQTKKKKPGAGFALTAMQLVFSKIGPIFPDFFAMRAYNMWFTTHRFKAPAIEQQYMKKAECSTINITDIDVAVYSWGEGKPVLFIHGWSGRGTQVAPYVDLLVNSGYRVISYDAPAHGKTPGKQTSILQIYDVIHALDEIHGGFHASITHSFGGMLLAYAMQYGFRTDKAVCICPPASIDSILDNFQRTLAIPDLVIERMQQRLFTMYGLGLKQRISTTENVRSIDIPALIIHDENDEDIDWHDGEAVAEAWPDAKFILTQGLGHRRILRDASTINKAIDFISA